MLGKTSGGEKMNNQTQHARAEIVFRAALAHSRLAIIIGLLFIVLAGSGLTRLVKDPSTDSLIPPNHPSIQMRDYAEEIFGLNDPIVVSVTSDGPDGIFTPTGLGMVRTLHDFLERHENIRPDRVLSIASESRIHGSDDALYIDSFYDHPPQTLAQADIIRENVFASDPHIGSIVSKDGSGALIIAEFHDQDLSGQTYDEVSAFIQTLNQQDIRIDVAGYGAVTGYLSGSIDRDARRLPPIAAVIIFVLIYFAFGRPKALVAPAIVTLATLVGAIGIMAWFGIPYFVITGALPVILISIAVADSIHILTGYFERRAQAPGRSAEEIVIETLVDLWRPLTLTTFTTMAGFIGIALASAMPPMAYFGWFAALGVFIAWCMSLFVLPVILVLLDMKPSPRIKGGAFGPIANILTNISLTTARRPYAVALIFGAIAVGVGVYAMKVEINYSRIENFQNGEPIREADEIINERFAGTAHLDVVINADSSDGLLDAKIIKKIADLQEFVEDQSYVEKSTSIADYISELHTALTGAPSGSLPDDDNAIAQYLLLHEASGDPSDLEDEISTDYQQALVRIYINAPYTDDQGEIVETLDAYLKNNFNEQGLKGSLSGRVNINYHWMQSLSDSHSKSVLLSLFFVFVIAGILLCSFALGILSLVPVGVALLAVYGVMGASGIFIEPGTSMGAAIAVGVGIDFAIHFIDRLQKGTNQDGLSVADAIKARFPASARACFLNAATLAIGFSALFVSELPPVFKLGLLIVIAALTSFVGGLIITTAVFSMMKRQKSAQQAQTAPVLSILILMSLGLAHTSDARAQTEMTGREIAEKIDLRNDGDHMRRHIRMELIDRRGKTRVREAKVFRQNSGPLTKSVIFYTSPSALRDTAFLTHDDKSGDSADRQWLYIPATRRPKQIPAADRGKYFLGTDFSYEDIRAELKFNLDDYQFERGERKDQDPVNSVRLIARPIDERAAKELGYGGVEALIDTQTWLPLEVAFEDTRGRPLKTVSVSLVEEVDGIWTAKKIEAHHLQNDHRTIFIYNDIAFGDQQSDRLFTPQGLRQGTP